MEGAAKTLNRADFETDEQFQAYKAKKEAAPKAAFQFGVKARPPSHLGAVSVLRWRVRVCEGARRRAGARRAAEPQAAEGLDQAEQRAAQDAGPARAARRPRRGHVAIRLGVPRRRRRGRRRRPRGDADAQKAQDPGVVRRHSELSEARAERGEAGFGCVARQHVHVELRGLRAREQRCRRSPASACVSARALRACPRVQPRVGRVSGAACATATMCRPANNCLWMRSQCGSPICTQLCAAWNDITGPLVRRRDGLEDCEAAGKRPTCRDCC